MWRTLTYVTGKLSYEALSSLKHVSMSVHCQYCARTATLSVEKDGIVVWLCERHFRERFEALQSSGWLESLAEQLDLENH